MFLSHLNLPSLTNFTPCWFILMAFVLLGFFFFFCPIKIFDESQNVGEIALTMSVLLLQDPDPPPQETNSVPPPMFFDPIVFSQPQAQASPRKSRYPGIRKN